MILCNLELHRALDDGRLVIDPEPQPRVPAVAGGHCPFDTHTVDLRLAEEIVVPRDDAILSIDLSQPGHVASVIQRNSTVHTLSEDRPYQLRPGKFILGRTIERVSLPIREQDENCLAARIEGKSSRARFGLLVHFTALTVHPGFDGTLTLEMINLGHWPIVLNAGMAIAQLIVEQVLGRPQCNPSQFQGQATAAGLVAGSRQASAAHP